jgi:benzoate/toluate 1,2-dioxygenase alpha subunit
MKPLKSGASPEDEGLYVLHHQHWVEEMLRAIDKERSQFIATASA